MTLDPLWKHGIPPQLFVSRAKPDATGFTPASDHERRFGKPYGGLWTSTLRDGGSAWVDWCEVEGFRTDIIRPENMHIIHMRQDAKVYHINSIEDAARLAPVGDPWDFSLRGPSWNDLAQEYDAIHLTELGLMRCRFDVTWLYGWDCESTVWLNWCVEEVQALGGERIAK